jgi:hypothetical protein
MSTPAHTGHSPQPGQKHRDLVALLHTGHGRSQRVDHAGSLEAQDSLGWQREYGLKIASTDLGVGRAHTRGAYPYSHLSRPGLGHLGLLPDEHVGRAVAS